MDNYLLLQKHQLFIQKFFASDVSIAKKIFLFYSTGSGKTLAAILASEYYVNYINKKNNPIGKIIIICNKATKSNFIWSIVGEGGNVANYLQYDAENPYITREELKKLDELRLNEHTEEGKKKFRKIKKEYVLTRLHDAGYEFHTYNAFARDTIFEKIPNFNNSLVIVDEAHTLIHDNLYYKAFNQISEKSKNYKLILLTATPAINSPENFVSFINLLNDDKLHRTDLFEGAGNTETNVLKKGFENVIIDKLRG